MSSTLYPDHSLHLCVLWKFFTVCLRIKNYVHESSSSSSEGWATRADPVALHVPDSEGSRDNPWLGYWPWSALHNPQAVMAWTDLLSNGIILSPLNRKNFTTVSNAGSPALALGSLRKNYCIQTAPITTFVDSVNRVVKNYTLDEYPTVYPFKIGNEFWIVWVKTAFN